LANAPYSVPGTLLALGLLLAWSRELRFIFFERLTLALDLFSGVGALLVAYSTKYLAFGVRVAKSGLVQIDRSLEEAARTSGASALRTAFDVVVPLLLPSLGAAWLLVFLPVLSEITMSVLLVGPQTPVLGTVLFELQSYLIALGAVVARAAGRTHPRRKRRAAPRYRRERGILSVLPTYHRDREELRGHPRLGRGGLRGRPRRVRGAARTFGLR
jgi:iron(III) transport system permease protein